MKTIKQIREEYDNITLSQVQVVPDELVLEGRESAVKQASKAAPSPANMPAMLLFRRVQYRSFPGNQTVALYYSKMVNKYLSVPFGPDGNLNLSESVILDSIDEGVIGDTLKGAAHGAVKGAFIGAAVAPGPGTVIGTLAGAAHGAYKGAKKSMKAVKEEDMNEDWQDVNRKDKTDGLSQKAVNAYRREHPGSKLKTAVTEKNPSGKRAARRKSFCSRMGGMKKRLTSAKTARDPDSRINKALRRWNCEESFRQKLAEKRELREGVADFLLSKLPQVAKYGKQAGKYALVKGKNLFSKASKSPKTAPKQRKAPPTKQTPGKQTPDLNVDDLAKALTDKKGADTTQKDSAITPHKSELLRAKNEPQMSSSFKQGPHDTNPTFTARYRQSLVSKGGTVNENKISDIQNMLNEGVDTMNLSINGRTITLNNSMAKKIVRVYESVNTKNKKIVESMLNEDLDSFKKLLNFSIKA